MKKTTTTCEVTLRISLHPTSYLGQDCMKSHEIDILLQNKSANTEKSQKSPSLKNQGLSPDKTTINIFFGDTKNVHIKLQGSSQDISNLLEPKGSLRFHLKCRLTFHCHLWVHSTQIVLKSGSLCFSIIS